jgi:hypothetical protein
MKAHIVCGAMGIWMAASGAVLAESQQGVLVELYTSQGCSSCPPADDLLGQLVEMPGVIGLALHVDYWDYIGWKDTFGQEKFSARQRGYAHAAGDKMIYTPQMIIDGGARMVGNDPQPVVQAIKLAAAVPQTITLTLAREAGQLHIDGKTQQPLPAGTTVQLVHYLETRNVEIERGENAGLTMDYRNVVTSWQSLGEWTGLQPLQMVADAGEGPVVVLIQAAGPRAVLAAAQLK